MLAHDTETASLADWRAVHAVNLDGTFPGCRYAIGAMKHRGTGSIINMSSRSGPDRAARMADIVADTPLKRFGTVEEVATLAVFLASDDSGYMTGVELVLDGGLLAGSAASPG